MFWFHPLSFRASFPITNTMSAMSKKKKESQSRRPGRSAARVDGFLGEREFEEQVSPVLVIRERMTQDDVGNALVPRIGTEFPWIAKRAARFTGQLGHNTLGCNSEPAIEALAGEIGRARQEGSQTVKPVPWGHRTCGRTRCRPGQDTESCTGASHGDQSIARRKDIVLADGVCGIPDEPVRCRQRREDAASEAAWPKGEHTDAGVWRKDPVHARQTSKRGKVEAAVPPRSVCWHAELTHRQTQWL